jgi:glycosyltransferase involved in cell wall biosynthesis
MRLLFVHQNMPGQYRHLIKYYSSIPGCEVACIGESKNITRWAGIKGVRIHGYGEPKHPSNATHAYIRGFEEHVSRGQLAARAADEIKKSGFEPDVICVHPGWGEGLYLKDIFPNSKMLSFCEFYYNAEGSDTNFEKKGTLSLDKQLLTRTRNATQLLSLTSSDWCISPTEWQKSQYPEIFRNRISVIHDGIDTEIAKPNPDASIRLASGVSLKSGDEVITFVNRNLEPYRGFHIFARALPLIQKLRPNAHVLIVGGDGVSYGSLPPPGTTYRKMFMEEVKGKVDMSKIHFLGMLPYDLFINVLQISSAHVYFTYPFVLSWSMLEAMACGCAVIGSRTQPVEEVIEEGKNGLLVDFFSPDGLAAAVDKVLGHKNRMQNMREAAREAILKKYDLKTICLPAQVKLIDELCDNKISIKE